MDATGHRIVTDHGATRDAIPPWQRGAVMRICRRGCPTRRSSCSSTTVPGLCSLTVPTPSGYGTVRRLIQHRHQRSRDAFRCQGGRIIHSCAADVPIALLRDGGADALSIDFTSGSWLSAGRLDALGEAVDAGVRLLLGIVPSLDSTLSATERAGKIRHFWNVLGYPPEQLASVVVPTTSCGLAGASMEYMRRALQVTREIGQDLLQTS